MTTTPRIPQLSMEAFSLKGKVAIVTGGSDGIGRFIAHSYVDAGAKVTIAARRQEKIDTTLAELNAKGADAIGVSTDVTDEASIGAMVQQTIDRWGKIDILVNVVGGSQGPTFKRGLLLDIAKEDFVEAFNINVTSGFLCCQAVVPHMMKQGSGVVINIASIGAREFRLPEPVMSVYNMTKASVMHLTRSMAKEWAPTVRVNCINAGHFLTPRRIATEAPERRERSLNEIEVGRFGEAEDIGAAAVYIASDAGAFFNGSFLDLNGGT